MDAIRTPDDRFRSLPGYPFAPHYVEVDGLRVHCVDEGARSAPPALLLHGEPSWSYLYRKMIPPLVASGLRVVAPDLPGFGRSDKPTDPDVYTYERHVAWMRGVLDALDLRGTTLVCQDWGGLIGLRLVAEHADRFSRIIAANTFLPTGDRPPGPAFLAWQRFSQETPDFPVGQIVRGGCTTDVPADVVAAYDAPFPDERFKAGARRFPLLVPTRPDDPAAAANRRAWDVLRAWRKPFLTAFGDSDPITKGADAILQKEIAGAAGQPHTTIAGAGHFIQEDRGEELARVVIDFVRRTA